MLLVGRPQSFLEPNLQPGKPPVLTCPLVLILVLSSGFSLPSRAKRTPSKTLLFPIALPLLTLPTTMPPIFAHIAQNAKSSYFSSIIVGNSVINTSTEISDEFNKHFCCISKKLSDEANNFNLANFNQYLSNRVSSSLFLHQTIVSKIFNLINQLNCNISYGADGIDVFCKG